jgi:hypothetical protein
MAAISAVIPAVFLFKFYYTVANNNSGNNIHAARRSSVRLRIRPLTASGSTASTATTTRASPSASSYIALEDYLAFLKSVDYTVPYNLENSDVVELHHCNVTRTNVNWTDFVRIADPLLRGAVEALRQPLMDMVAASATPHNNPSVTAAAEDYYQDMHQEFLLELLEQYQSAHGACDYSRYRPTVVGHWAQGIQLRKVSSLGSNSRGQRSRPHRLAIVISAFRDIEHLSRLLEAMHQPQHYIVVHLERHCPMEYQSRVQDMLRARPHYRNVVIVQFGTIVYRTDSLSMINLRILRWLTMDLNLHYEHAILMDGSAFPLCSASELVAMLHQQSANGGRAVWLGELTAKGQQVSATCSGIPGRQQSPPLQSSDHLLQHKRLIFTSRGVAGNLKLHKRLPMPKQGKESGNGNLPAAIRDHLIYKSTSGNQGIYSRYVVEQLLNSDNVMELFALSKYGCCCCLEERNWIAALGMIGFACEALEQTSMFQVWGGESAACSGTMNNAFLSSNATLCFRSEDPGTSRNVTSAEGYFHGGDMWDLLVDAKRRGFLFARKFRSDQIDSVELLNKIQSELWMAPFR